jgi:hypothetical protein
LYVVDYSAQWPNGELGSVRSRVGHYTVEETHTPAEAIEIVRKDVWETLQKEFNVDVTDIWIFICGKR